MNRAQRGQAVKKPHFIGGIGGPQLSDYIRIDRLCRSGGEFAAICRKHDPNFKKEAEPLF